MLVHDSIVVIAADAVVEQAAEILARMTQKSRGCEISGTPIGVDADIHQDYSVGKFEKRYEIIGNRLSRILPT